RNVCGGQSACPSWHRLPPAHTAPGWIVVREVAVSPHSGVLREWVSARTRPMDFRGRDGVGHPGARERALTGNERRTTSGPVIYELSARISASAADKRRGATACKPGFLRPSFCSNNALRPARYAVPFTEGVPALPPRRPATKFGSFTFWRPDGLSRSNP